MYIDVCPFLPPPHPPLSHQQCRCFLSLSSLLSLPTSLWQVIGCVLSFSLPFSLLLSHTHWGHPDKYHSFWPDQPVDHSRELIVFSVYSSTWSCWLTKITCLFSKGNPLFVDSQYVDLLCISQSIYQYLIIKLFKQRIKYAFPTESWTLIYLNSIFLSGSISTEWYMKGRDRGN